MRAEDVVVLAAHVRENYSPRRLDTGVSDPAVVEDAAGFRSVVLTREQMSEPYRSFRLLHAAAVGEILVITFCWDDGTDNGTVFLMPLDTREIELDTADDVAVTSFLAHHLEFTLGGPRKTWEAARSTPLGPRFAVVRSFEQA